MIKPIIIWPDTRLYQKSIEVPVLIVPTLSDLINDMWDTCYDVHGVGLSAVQIGNPVRVMVMDVYKPYVLINPVISSYQGLKEPKNEGCLSLPGILERVERYDALQVNYLDEVGAPHSAVFTGMEAQCIQHELDHFDGILIPDKVGSIERERIRKAMKERKK